MAAKKENDGLYFATGMVIGVPLGIVAARIFWSRREKSPRRFKPPFLSQKEIPQDPVDPIKGLSRADKRPDEAREMPQGG